MAPRQLTALLAMPAALRPLVLAAAASPARPFSAGRRLGVRSFKGPLAVGAFTAPRLPTTRPWAAVPAARLLESPADPDASLADALRDLFARTPATFYHGTSNFYELKKNTQVPEICILGRSNVGKSTFVNALANRRGSALARVSSKAGHTKAMNLYGFGPAPHPADLLAAAPEAKKTEDMPKHRLYVVDMPGYGHKSLRQWGRHIELYLKKRAAARGAVLLIDAEVGPKDNDFQALDMLCEHGLRTTVVLTKADKARHEDVLRATCQRVLLYIRELAARPRPAAAARPWAWEPDFFVTAVGATRKETGVHSVDVARLAVARLAGMIEEKERAEPDEAPSWSGNIVSFDQLEAQYAPPPASPKPPAGGRSPDAPPPAPADDSASWTPLERAARAQYQAQTTTTASSPAHSPSSSAPPPRPTGPRPRQQTRAFHTQPDRRHKGKPTGHLQSQDWIDFEAQADSKHLEIESEERLESERPHKIARPDHHELTKVLKTFIEDLRKDLPPAPQPRLSPGIWGEPVPEEERRREKRRLERLRRRQEAIFAPLRKSLAQYSGDVADDPFPPPKPPKPLPRYRHGEIFDPLHKPRWWPPDVYAARMEARNAERRRHLAVADQRLVKEEVAAERRRLREQMEEEDRRALEASQKRGGRRKARQTPGRDDLADQERRWADEDLENEEEEEEDEDEDEDEDDDDDAASPPRDIQPTPKRKKVPEARKQLHEAIARASATTRNHNPKTRRRAAQDKDKDDDDDAFAAHFKNRR